MKRTWGVLCVLCVILLCLSSLQVLSQESRSQSTSKTRLDTEKPISRMVKQAKDEGRQFPVVDLFQNHAPPYLKWLRLIPKKWQR
jgi:hypothetical protein